MSPRRPALLTLLDLLLLPWAPWVVEGIAEDPLLRVAMALPFPPWVIVGARGWEGDTAIGWIMDFLDLEEVGEDRWQEEEEEERQVGVSGWGIFLIRCRGSSSKMCFGTRVPWSEQTSSWMGQVVAVEAEWSRWPGLKMPVEPSDPWMERCGPADALKSEKIAITWQGVGLPEVGLMGLDRVQVWLMDTVVRPPLGEGPGTVLLLHLGPTHPPWDPLDLFPGPPGLLLLMLGPRDLLVGGTALFLPGLDRGVRTLSGQGLDRSPPPPLLP